jgi:enterochelin esterase-like enzyme
VYACRWRNLSRCPDTSATTVWNAQSEEQERANAEAGRNLLELLQPKSKLLPLMRHEFFFTMAASRRRLWGDSLSALAVVKRPVEWDGGE